MIESRVLKILEFLPFVAGMAARAVVGGGIRGAVAGAAARAGTGAFLNWERDKDDDDEDQEDSVSD